MKTSCFISVSIFMWLFSEDISAQVVLENVYSNGVNYGNGIEFRLQEIDEELYKYVLVDIANEKITLYNLNHTLFAIIDIPEPYTPYIYKVQYITRTLFDCDTTDIEYLLLWTNSDPSYSNDYVRLYEDDGTILFEQDTAMGWISLGGSGVFNSYIVNTPDGTKMILDDQANGMSYVYTLCGKLPTSYNLVDESSDMSMRVFPNPSSNYTEIEYELPSSVSSAELRITNTGGSLIKNYMIDKTFSNVLLSTEDLPAGVYYYNIIIDGHPIEAEKVVIIK